MNQATSHIAALLQSYRKCKFSKVNMERKKKKGLINRECIVLGPEPQGNEKGLLEDFLPMLTRKFQVGWLKVTFLGVGFETAVRLAIKSWFADLGFSTNDSILDLLSFFF